MTGRDLAALAGQENVVIIRRPFVEWLGNIPDALLIDQILYWQNRAGVGEWWHLSDQDMGDRLLLSKKAIAPSRDRLVSLGFVRTERRGLPYRTFYMADLDKIAKSFGEHVSSVGITSRPPTDDKPSDTGRHSIEGGVKGVRKVKALTPNPHGGDAPSTSTPPTPTVQAGQPGDQDTTRAVPTRGSGSTTPSRAQRSTKTDRSSSPEGESEARGGRWHPVAAAIMAALGRPAPRGKLPSWLGNTVATFGAAAGDDVNAALVLVAGWAKSRPFREALERGIVRDHTVPALVGSWIIAGNGGQPQSGVARQADPEERRMQRLGAPTNWRDIVYAPGGVKRAPVLALPRMGLEPYAQQGEWPAWYRAFEGVGS